MRRRLMRTVAQVMPPSTVKDVLVRDAVDDLDAGASSDHEHVRRLASTSMVSHSIRPEGFTA